MSNLFEYGDIINHPIECFYFDSEKQEYPVRSHWHFYMEILLMTEGTAQITSDSQELILRENEMIIFHPQSVHMIRSKEPVKFIGLKFDLNAIESSTSQALKFRNIYRCARDNRMPTVFNASLCQKMDVPAIFKRCFLETEQQEYGYHQLIRAKINELLLEIIRHWNSQGFVIDNASYTPDDYDIYTITEFIDKNLHTSIQIPDIAKACNMSYSYFAKKFPAVYGKTCKEYIEEMRLYKVEEYLLFTDFDLNYIAQETGFSDCSHMIKSFKKHRGITPKKFRDGK